MDLAAITDFNLVAKHGGFGAASRASAMSKATLSRRVRELEESLGVRLIERGVRPLQLTEEGAALYARTEEPFGAIADTVQAIKAGLNTRADACASVHRCCLSICHWVRWQRRSWRPTLTCCSK